MIQSSTWDVPVVSHSLVSNDGAASPLLHPSVLGSQVLRVADQWARNAATSTVAQVAGRLLLFQMRGGASCLGRSSISNTTSPSGLYALLFLEQKVIHWLYCALLDFLPASLRGNGGCHTVMVYDLNVCIPFRQTYSPYLCIDDFLPAWLWLPVSSRLMLMRLSGRPRFPLFFPQGFF